MRTEWALVAGLAWPVGWGAAELANPTGRTVEVTVQTFAGDAMRVDIVTPLFAISGHSDEQRCRVADGSPDGCALRIEHRIPLTLRPCGTLPASLS